MASQMSRGNMVQLTDWQRFTNNGNFNNPVPPSRRLQKRYARYSHRTDASSSCYRCQTPRSRNQSAVTTSTQRILSARSINYRRAPRVKPVDLDLSEECEKISVYPSSRSRTGRMSTTSSQIWSTAAWSFSYLHRAIIAIDEQAKKDYAAGRRMHALAAWQNALVYCEELDHREQLWPENKAQIDEEIATLRRTYKKYMDEFTKNGKNLPQETGLGMLTRQCSSCFMDQPLDKFHQRFNKHCEHVERTICDKCIFNSAKRSRQNSECIEIPCPEPQCTATLDFKQIRQVLNTVYNNESAEPTETRERRAKSRSPDRKGEFIWCAHEGCESGQFHISREATSSTVTCILCKRQTCAVHRMKWHEGLTCEEYDRQQQRILLNQIKPCPGCQSNIDQNPNSERTSCPKCKYEFCWECLADYKPIVRGGAQQHKSTCKHYENKPKKSRTCTIL